MRKKCLFLMISVMLMTLAATTSMAQGKNSPFLITGKIPHLTKMLMQQWENPELNLSDQQKPELLKIRSETLTSVRKLIPEINSLEKQVADGIFSGQTPDDLNSVVTAIAKLKAEETMIQLRCIDATRKILNQHQLDILLHHS